VYKIRNKKFALLLTIMFVLTIMMPLAAPVSAATGLTPIAPTTVGDDEVVKLGRVLVELPMGALSAGDELIITLPSDFEFCTVIPAAGVPRTAMSAANWLLAFGTAATTTTADYNLYGRNAAPAAAGNQNYIQVPALVGTEVNALYQAAVGPTNLTVDKLKDRQIRVTVNAVSNNTRAWFYLNLGAVYVPDNHSGDINVDFFPVPGSGFVGGTVTVGKVATGEVTLAMDSTPTFTDRGTAKIKVTESIGGAFENTANSVKLRLPNGFEWVTGSYVAAVGPTYGSLPAAGVTATINGRDLAIVPTGGVSTTPSAFVFNVDIQVTDESRAKLGDIEAALSGNSDLSVSTLVVGKYYEMGCEVKAGSKETVLAGRMGQEIGKIVVEETAPGSLSVGRNITLTLPNDAKWVKLPTVSSENGLTVNTVAGPTFVGSDGKAIRYIINGASTSDLGKLTFKDAEIVLAPDFAAGELKVAVSGTAGVTGEVVVADVKPAVSVAVEKVDVKIGVQDQAAGDITITESAKEALTQNYNLTVNLPEGVWFSATPKVEVTEGDLSIDSKNVRRANSDRQLIIPVDGESTKASTIKITGVKLTTNRTYPEGKIEVKVGGDAAVSVNSNAQIAPGYWTVGTEVNAAGSVALTPGATFANPDYTISVSAGAFSFFPNVTTAAKAIMATNITPAPGDTKQDASFVIGSKTYTLNGVEAEMDVVPYVKDGRTYLPVRYVGYALGVDANNILWDGKTATLIKGDKVVQVTVGSKAMIVNGRNHQPRCCSGTERRSDHAPVPLDRLGLRCQC